MMDVEFLVEDFADLKQIGCGTYGIVLKGKSTEDKKMYAIKLCKPKKVEGADLGGHFDIPYTSLREVIVLKKLKHPNLISLTSVKFNSKNFALVFPFYPGTLEQVIRKIHKKGLPSDMTTIKTQIYEIIKAIDHMHRNRIIHRDIKPENIFIDDKDSIKIGDFGLSRVVTQPLRPYTNEVMTMLYRSPELILGETNYCIGVDLWGIGCIIAELYLGKPLFSGATGELDLIHLQFELFGTPKLDHWPRMKELKNYNPKMLKLKRKGIKHSIPHIDDMGADLIEKLMRMNPDRRIPCSELLKHPYFRDIL